MVGLGDEDCQPSRWILVLEEQCFHNDSYFPKQVWKMLPCQMSFAKIVHVFILSAFSACLSYTQVLLCLNCSKAQLLLVCKCYLNNYPINMSESRISSMKRVYFLLPSIIKRLSHHSQTSSVHVKWIHESLCKEKKKRIKSKLKKETFMKHQQLS